jgi:predicted GH43/DUF377 family glycosyl hydrolase
MPLSLYDLRLVKIEDTYYILWRTDFYGAAISMAKAKDFKRFERLPDPFFLFNRNAVLFCVKPAESLRCFPARPAADTCRSVMLSCRKVRISSTGAGTGM